MHQPKQVMTIPLYVVDSNAGKSQDDDSMDGEDSEDIVKVPRVFDPIYKVKTLTKSSSGMEMMRMMIHTTSFRNKIAQTPAQCGHQEGVREEDALNAILSPTSDFASRRDGKKIPS